MTTQITLPPTRADGDPNPPADMNLVSGALAAMSATVYITPTGDNTGTDDTANLNAALDALPATGGTVWLSPGTFYITCGSVTITSVYVYIRGSGMWATTISAVGTGDCIRIYNTDTSGLLTGGGVLGFAIDGTNAGDGSNGLHYGDMRAGQWDIAVMNFDGTGSAGVLLDNQYAWTEECHGYFWFSNNTRHLVFNVGGADTSENSFGYTDLTVEILSKTGPAGTGQDGVVLQNGALLYNSKLAVRANFQSSSTTVQTNAVIRITGQVPAGHPNAGSYAAIHSCRLDVQAECNATGSHTPQTIVWGSVTGANSILGCTGVLDFAQGGAAFAQSNWTATGGAGAFSFSGIIRGDFNLNNAQVGIGAAYPALSVSGATVYGKSLLNPANGNLNVDAGDFFSNTLTGSITINLNAGGAAAMGGAQRKTIVIKQAASGGPYTVTWPNTGSPTVSSCSVVWAGGTAPTMSTGASAVDVYHLETYDGATWYGTATQNVS